MNFECSLVQKYHPKSTMVIDDYYVNDMAFDFSKKTGRNIFEIGDIDDKLKECKGCAFLTN